jgi:DnaK suppressor protein
MDAQAVKPFQDQLLAQRTELLAQMAEQRGGHISRAEAASNQYDNSQDDVAQISTARDEAFAINEHETAELLAIEEALTRIQEGVYGFCLSCGIPMAHDRLHAAPTAMRCVMCQNTFEKQHAH